MASKRDHLVPTSYDHARKVDDNLVLLNKTMRGMAKSLDQFVVQRSFDELLVEVSQQLRSLESRISSWERAVFNALQGRLDPAFAPLDQIQHALERLERTAAKSDLRPVPQERPTNLIFDNPTTTTYNRTRLHIIVAVPLVPFTAPILDLTYVTIMPTLVEPLLVQHQLEDRLLAFDAAGKWHMTITSIQLHLCRRTADSLYLCHLDQIQSTPTTCMAALVSRPSLVTKLCKMFTVTNSTHIYKGSSSAIFRSLTPATAVTKCLHSKEEWQDTTLKFLYVDSLQ